jgi:hypothetical protein
MGAIRFSSNQDVDRHFGKGIGTGEGVNYRPGFLVREFPASSRSSILPCEINGRELQLLNPLDRDYCLLIMHFGKVSDIRESMPAHPSRTLAIAKALGLHHPVQTNGVPKILLTSFVLTMKDQSGKPLNVARSILPVPKRGWSAQQIRERLITLEILRVYWKMQGMPWSIVSAHQVNRTLVQNVDFAFEATKVDEIVRDIDGYDVFLEAASTLDWTSAAIEVCVRSIARDTRRSFEETMNFFKLGLWMRDVRFDMTKVRIHTTNSLSAQPEFVARKRMPKTA